MNLNEYAGIHRVDMLKTYTIPDRFQFFMEIILAIHMQNELISTRDCREMCGILVFVRKGN